MAAEEMPWWHVTLTGEAREVYAVQAESAEAAAEVWSSGQQVVLEASGMDVTSVEPAEGEGD